MTNEHTHTASMLELLRALTVPKLKLLCKENTTNQRTRLIFSDDWLRRGRYNSLLAARLKNYLKINDELITSEAIYVSKLQ